MEQNLAERLQQGLHPVQMELVRVVAGEATRMGLPLYMVGGLVRDLLLGRDGIDIDLVVEGDAAALARALAGTYGGKVTVHSKFGTAKWEVRGSGFGNGKSAADNDSRLPIPEFLDLVSARSETYKQPAALPTVKMGKIEDDLRRRDFTINTLAVRLDGQDFGRLRDDYGGVEDLQQGLIRVLHNRSFIDDPTRMYRAVRYEQRFGFKVADETLRLMPESLALVDRLSAQRVRHELDLIMDEPRKAAILGRLAELDLLKPIHAALPWDHAVHARLQAKGQPELIGGGTDERMTAWLLWLMTLPQNQIESVNKRLHFTASLLKALLAASALFSDLKVIADQKPSSCVETLEVLPLPAVYAVYLGAPVGKAKTALQKYLGEWRHVRPKITGNDLKKRGLTPGPAYRKILRELRNAWLDEEIRDVEGEKKRLEESLRGL